MTKWQPGRIGDPIGLGGRGDSSGRTSLDNNIATRRTGRHIGIGIGIGTTENGKWEPEGTGMHFQAQSSLFLPTARQRDSK